MARAVTTRHKIDRHGRRLDRRPADLLPDPLHDHHLASRPRPRRSPGFNLIPSFTLESYAEVQSAERLLQAVHELGDPRRSARPSSALLIAIPAAWSMAFSPTKRTKDILMWMLSTKMMPAVGGAGADLPDLPRPRPARHPHRPDRHADADQPADRHLDALHLLPRDPRRDPRGGAHGRRLALGRDLATC